VGIGLSAEQRAELLANSSVATARTLPAYDRFGGTVTALGGTNSAGVSGADGTIVWLWVASKIGTVFTMF